MSNEDDLNKTNSDPQAKDENARIREGDRATDAEAAPEEGMPSVNRKKKNNRGMSILIIAFVVLIGLVLIVKLNSGPNTKKVADSKAIVTSQLPAIDLTPAPPPQRAPAADTNGAPANGRDGSNGTDYRPPVAPVASVPAKGPDGKPIVHWTDRKLRGDVVIKSQNAQQTKAQQQPGGRVPDYADEGHATTTSESGGGMGSSGGAGRDNLGSRLTGTPTPMVSASLLRGRDFLLTKGTALDCIMDVAIDTSLPGIITCTLSGDVYSNNRHTLLMERGTKMVGEQQGNVKAGQARVFALWTRAETPNGVVINLNSPGTDSLGRSGLDGWVDNHFAERFGAAILASFIQSSLKYMVASQENGSPTTIVGDSADSGEDVVGKILDNTINIPPTILKNQGDHINIMVARDLNFDTVYALEAQ